MAPVRGYSFDEGKCRGSAQLHTHTRLIAAASLGRPPPEYVTPSGSVPIPSAGMVYGPSRTVDGGCGTAPTIPSTRRRFESGAAAEWGTRTGVSVGMHGSVPGIDANLRQAEQSSQAALRCRRRACWWRGPAPAGQAVRARYSVGSGSVAYAVTAVNNQR